LLRRIDEKKEKLAADLIIANKELEFIYLQQFQAEDTSENSYCSSQDFLNCIAFFKIKTQS